MAVNDFREALIPLRVSEQTLLVACRSLGSNFHKHGYMGVGVQSRLKFSDGRSDHIHRLTVGGKACTGKGLLLSHQPRI